MKNNYEFLTCKIMELIVRDMISQDEHFGCSMEELLEMAEDMAGKIFDCPTQSLKARKFCQDNYERKESKIKLIYKPDSQDFIEIK